MRQIRSRILDHGIDVLKNQSINQILRWLVEERFYHELPDCSMHVVMSGHAPTMPHITLAAQARRPHYARFRCGFCAHN